MRRTQRSLVSLFVICAIVVPLFASAATVAHPPPPLPPGAKVGVPYSGISSSTFQSAAPASPSVSPTVRTTSTATGNLAYVEIAIAAVVAFALGFFFGQKKH